jgi:hypothetical protein
LRENRPVYALCNLRRPGSLDALLDARLRDDSEEHRAASDWFLSYMEAGKWEEAAQVFEFMETAHWMFWSPTGQKPGVVPFIEDVFIAEKGWLDTFSFATRGSEMPFQDVYDLMNVTFQMMAKFKCAPQCIRMPQTVNRIMHLWHKKDWSSFAPEIRDWFMSNPERWKGTRYLDSGSWVRLLPCKGGAMPRDNRPVNDFRWGPGGTVQRWGLGISQWLQKGGMHKMLEYYRLRK